MKRVIVALDGSALSEQSIPAATHLARVLGYSLELVHVIERPYREDGPEVTILPSTETVKRNLTDVAERYEVDIPVSFNVLIGDPVRRLLQVSERDPEAIIVLATHGRSGVVRAVLGSVADKIVRGASGPVLLIRPTATAQPRYALGTILVGLDGSKFAERSLPFAVELAKASGARLHLVRVIESLWTLAYPASPYDGAVPDPQLIQQLDEEATADAMAYLAATGAILRNDGVDVTWDVEKGNPVDEILTAASRVSASLIVTTTHGRGGMSRMFHGSVATGLASRSNVPLMILPATRAGGTGEVRYESETVLLL